VKNKEAPAVSRQGTCCF